MAALPEIVDPTLEAAATPAVISRAEAKAAGLKRYFLDAPCPNGHNAERYVSSGGCVECTNDRIKKVRRNNPKKNRELCRSYYVNNKEKVKAKKAAYRTANSEAIKARNAAYRAANGDKCSTLNKKWHEKNRSYRAECDRKRRAENLEEARRKGRERQKANLAYASAYVAARNAHKLKAMPTWADAARIKTIYAAAKSKSEYTGIEHHVDHIVPLRGRNVCGLHVHYNLRIITAESNMLKGNRLMDDENV